MYYRSWIAYIESSLVTGSSLFKKTLLLFHVLEISLI